MNVLFVFPNTGSGYSFHPGIQTLSAIAKKEGHQTSLLHLHEKYGMPNDIQKLKPLIDSFQPRVIAFTATDFEYAWVEKLAGQMREIYPNLFYLLGGKSAILGKDLSLSHFDAFCVGESEIEFAELLRRLECNQEFVDLPSFWFRKDGKIIKNNLGSLVTNLDNLPPMDYEIFNTTKLLQVRSKMLSVQFTRGCPYSCTYCFVTADKKTMFQQPHGYDIKNYLRKRSVESAMQELEHLCQTYGENIEVFNLDDELPLIHKTWMLDFCRNFKERIYDQFGVEFIVNGRVDILTEEMVRALKESGCREVRLGFESGNFRIRKEILDKPITDEQLRHAYCLCDQFHLRASAFTMIGIPTETEETIRDTFRMTAELKPYLIRLTFCYPFQNTRLWDYVLQNELLKSDRYLRQSGYFEENVLKHEHLTDQKLAAYRFLFPWFVNALLLPDGEIKQSYKSSIQKYQELNFKDPNIFESIRQTDSLLSERCDRHGELEHYRYFDRNMNYFLCKNKRYPAGKNSRRSTRNRMLSGREAAP